MNRQGENIALALLRGMAAPGSIIRCGEIAPIVSPSTLLAKKGRSGHQPGDGEKIPGGNGQVCSLHRRECRERPLQSVLMTDDPDLRPQNLPDGAGDFRIQTPLRRGLLGGPHPRAGLSRSINRPACGARSKDEPFEQRVARQPIRSVNPGAGHFTGGVEPFDARPAVGIGSHSAHEIMSCRGNGDRFPGDVNAIVSTGGVDAGESSLEELLIEMREIEIDAVAPGFEHALEDGPGDDVAGGQFGFLMNAEHEAITESVS